MVKFYPSINSDHAEFMLKQPLFYVASAPYAGTHVNLSPKGQPSRSFAVRGENSMAYVDATGSGCETISHVYENGRVTVMFCSFGVSPKIMRLFCRGTVIELGDKKFEPLAAKMGHSVGLPGARAIILLDVYKLQTSCGFGVPLIGNSKNATTPWESETEDDGQNTHDEEKNMGSVGGFSDRPTMDKWANARMRRGHFLGTRRTPTSKVWTAYQASELRGELVDNGYYWKIPRLMRGDS